MIVSRAFQFLLKNPKNYCRDPDCPDCDSERGDCTGPNICTCKVGYFGDSCKVISNRNISLGNFIKFGRFQFFIRTASCCLDAIRVIVLKLLSADVGLVGLVRCAAQVKLYKITWWYAESPPDEYMDVRSNINWGVFARRGILYMYVGSNGEVVRPEMASHYMSEGPIRVSA